MTTGDLDELRRLSTGYASAVDSLDGLAFAALFTPDGELWVPDVRHSRAPTICRSGTDSLAAIPSGLARYHRTCHGVGATDYVVDGDRATGTVRTVAHHLAAAGPTGGGTDTVWYLTYDDGYRRTSDGWRIARRVLRLRDVEERTVAHLGPARRT